MKTSISISVLFLLSILIFSCQKQLEFEPIVAQQSAGSLSKNNTGDCFPITVNGIYKVNKPLDNTNYMDVSVNVTSAGSYLIITDTVNGIYFKDSADFTATGAQTVRLKGYGTPLAVGTVSLTVHYNNSSSCAAQLTVSPAVNATASFTLAGAPGSCTAPVIQGSYIAGTALDPSNKLVLAVNVTSIGDYTLSTNIANGFSFSATGTFTATGTQTVTLSGTGTPATAGATTMSVTGAPAGCSFTITVNSPAPTITKLKRIIQSYVGSRKAFIITLSYDFNDRLISFREWEEDSSFTPIKITSSNYSAFTYSGSGEKPVKNIITHESAGGPDSTLYSYDSQNRVTQEDCYNGTQISVRNVYTYLSPTIITRGKYINTGTLQFMGTDSLIFDAQNRILETRSYNPSNVYTGNSTYLYDNKNNPFFVVNVFKYAFTLYGDDAKYFYRSPNNNTKFTQLSLPSSTTIIDFNYNYNTGSLPIGGTASLTTGSPGSTQNFLLTYEYY